MWLTSHSAQNTSECRIAAVLFLGVQNKLPLPSRQMVDNVTTAPFLILFHLSFTTYPTNGHGLM